MKNLMKWTSLAALGLGVVGVAGSALATDSRINGLSGGGVSLTGNPDSPTASDTVLNEKSFTIRDSANIYTFPQFLPTYKNSVDSDATSGAKYGTMNIRYALSDDAVLLVYGKRSVWQPVTNLSSIAGATSGAASGYGMPNDPTNHQFGLGFGMKAGESLRLGAHASLGGRNFTDKTTNNKTQNNTLFQLGAGVGFDLSETNSMDFGIDLKVGSFTNQGPQGDLYTPNGLFRFGLIFKGEFQVHQIAKIVPYLNFAYDSRNVAHGQDQAGNGAKYGNAAMTVLQLGSDLAIQPVEGVLIQPGLGLAFATSNVNGKAVNDPNGQIPSQTLDASSNRIIPYYGFAAEAKAFDWMVLRLGARQQVVMTNIGNTATNPAPSNEEHLSNVVNTVTTGMGFKLMGWDLDLNVNPSFFNNGVYAVTGADTKPFAVDWALSYRW